MTMRYAWSHDGMEESDTGDLMDFGDHQREVAQLQARVAELEAALREYRAYAHHRDAGNTLSEMRHFEKFESDLERLLP